MSMNFATITPMSTATISKKPAYSVDTQQQPAASSPMDNGSQVPKKSHWFIKSLATIVVLGAAAGLGAKFLPNVFNSKAVLATDANIFNKGLHYAKVGVGHAGEFINKYAEVAYNWTKNLFNAKAAAGGTAPTGTGTVAP